MPRLVIIRGLPGSGKSTLAQVYRRNGFKWVEADMYFDSFLFGYRFDPAKLSEAHEWCKATVERYLSTGYNVVVSNTFTRRWEFEPYLEVAAKYEAMVDIVVTTGNYENVHGVPDSVIQGMRERWED